MNAVVYFWYDRIWHKIAWKCMQTHCSFLYHCLEGVSIPSNSPEDTNPLDEFEDTQVDQNVFRFVVFVLWLKDHFQAVR